MKNINQAGFTLTELIIAIVMLAVAIPAIAMFADVLLKLNDSSTDTVLANSIAENKVESLRSKGFNGIANGTTDFSSELPQELPSPRTGNYTVTATSASLKNVTVTISYGGKQTQYTTYIGELGVGQY